MKKSYPKPKNPYAIYLHTDGSMDYDQDSSGGIGYRIEFPDNIKLDPIEESVGKYVGANIEIIELEAIYQGMKRLLKVYTENEEILHGVKTIIRTDRYDLNDKERTNPYRIKQWRKNDWSNFENKDIKNSKLLDKIDKLRSKLNKYFFCGITIEYDKSKFNKPAHKLANAAKKIPIKIKDRAIKWQKIGRRKYFGEEINYTNIKQGEYYNIHVYKKRVINKQVEISCEICDEDYKGKKITIYSDFDFESKLKRGNIYSIQVKKVNKFHIIIENEIKQLTCNY